MSANQSPLAESIRRILMAIAFLAASITTLSAEILPVKTYTTADGLLRDTANCIKQDSRGFLWFCPSDGLSRFDGYGFVSYTTEDGLPHRSITDFLETRDGVYWVATRDGLARFNPKGKRGAEVGNEPRFTAFKPADNNEAREISVLFEDSRSVLWCGTADGLYKIETTDKQVVFHRIELRKDRSSVPLTVSSIIEDRRGNIWIGMDLDQGLNRVTPDGRVEHFRTERGKAKNESITTLFETKDGEIWAV